MHTHSGYSSKVRLTLHINGSQLALSHVGSKRIVVRDACEPLPASEAEIVIEVNDSAERYNVFLPNGLPGPDQLVDYV
jgi:hypothetical protein